MTLLEECIEKLGDEYEVYSKEESGSLFKEFENKFLFTPWGRIDWDAIKGGVLMPSREEMLNSFDAEYCYILWDEQSLPVIKARFKKVMLHIDDVLAVSFDTWLLGPSNNCVIEFFHEGDSVLWKNT